MVLKGLSNLGSLFYLPTDFSVTIKAMKPGEELIGQGIDDLHRGVESIESLLVSIGAHRLRRAGLAIPENTFPTPEHRLYILLSQKHGDNAHSKYNSYVRRLVSFERAAECEI
jgi:hypothetical protein